MELAEYLRVTGKIKDEDKGSLLYITVHMVKDYDVDITNKFKIVEEYFGKGYEPSYILYKTVLFITNNLNDKDIQRMVNNAKFISSVSMRSREEVFNAMLRNIDLAKKNEYIIKLKHTEVLKLGVLHDGRIYYNVSYNDRYKVHIYEMVGRRHKSFTDHVEYVVYDSSKDRYKIVKSSRCSYRDKDKLKIRFEV